MGMHVLFIIFNINSNYDHNIHKRLSSCYIAVFLAFLKPYIYNNLKIEKEKKNNLFSLLLLYNYIETNKSYQKNKTNLTIKRLHLITVMQFAIFKAKHDHISNNTSQ